MATTIALHHYLDQINQLLDDQRYEQAVRHCRRILQQYPRHVETYNLLAKALLELGQYSDAADLFKRVLSAEPDNFIAHVGLAVVCKEQGLGPQALWHMERAYEIDPYNATIQEELKQLYRIVHNGSAPNRLSLTPGALARLYMRGELYQPAVTELHQLLSRDTDRVDLEVLLAEALWRDNRRVEAVEVCLRIVEKLPNCVVANAILAEIWLTTGRIQEAQVYLQRLQALTQLSAQVHDVETVVGRAFNTEGAQPLPDKVPVAYLDEGAAPAAVAQPAASVEEITAPFKVTDEDQDLYDWLQGIELEPETTQEVLGEAEEEVPRSSTEWFIDQGTQDSEGPAVVEELSDWLGELDVEAELELLDFDFDLATEETTPADEVAFMPAEPDWLADVSEAEFEPEQVDPLLVSEWLSTAAYEDAPVTEDTVEGAGFDEDEDWLASLAEGDLAVDHPLNETDLSDLLESPDFTLGSLAEDEEADLPDWLAINELEGQQESKLPDWLLSSSLDVEDEVDAGQSVTADSTVDDLFGELGANLPGWLDSVEDSSPQEEEDLPDWLLSAGLATGELEEAVIGDNDEKEDRQQEFPEDEVGDFDEAMDWLEQLASGREETPDELSSLEDVDIATAGESMSDEELPDWLQALSSATDELGQIDLTIEVEEDTSDADLPEWLQEPAQEDEFTADERLTPVIPDDTPDEVEEAIGEAAMTAEPDSEDLSWLDDFATSVEMQAAEDEAEQADTMALFFSEHAGEDQAALLDWLELEPDQAKAAATSESALPVTAESEDEVLDSDVPEDLDEAIAWLEELAAHQDEAAEEEMIAAEPALEAEPPVMKEVEFELEDVTGPELVEPPLDETLADVEPAPLPEAAAAMEDVDEAMAWLEELVAQQGMSLQELDAGSEEQPVTEAKPDEEAWPEVELQAPVEEPEAMPALEAVDAPEDLEDAMVWLEALAARQGTPLEELPTQMQAVDRGSPAEIEPELVIEAETAAPPIPSDELEEALDWLEQLALENAVPLAALPTEAVTDDLSPEDELEDALDWLEQVALAEEMTPVEAKSVDTSPERLVDTAAAEGEDDLFGFAADMPDDPEAALSWLEQFVAGDAGSEGEDAPAIEETTTEAEPPLPVSDEAVEATATEFDLDLFTDMPDDPDDAVAWLERLALRQGAPPEELPSVTAADEAGSETTTDTALEDVLADLPDMDDVEAWLDLADVPELDQELAPEAGSPREDLDLAEDLADSTHEWFVIAPEEPPAPGQTGWLQSLQEPDVVGWLAAEEETMAEATDETGPLPALPEIESESRSRRGTGPLPPFQIGSEPEREPVIEEDSMILPVSEQVPSVLELDRERLAAARQAMAVSEYGAAIGSYQSLLEAGEGLATLIADLETAADKEARQPLIRRLLGDAYMRNGQLQKALDAYRQALDQL